MTTITVFGGTGFLGRRLVQRLAAEGASVRVVVRHPDPAGRALRATGLDHITVFGADVLDQAAVAAAVAGADAVVNAVSAYVEKGGVTFEAVHEQGAETVAREAAAAGVARLLLVSGIGADPKSGSPYIRARGRVPGRRFRAAAESRQKPAGTRRNDDKSRQKPTKAYTVKNVGFCRHLSAFVVIGAGAARLS